MATPSFPVQSSHIHTVTKNSSGLRKHCYCWSAYHRPDNITDAQQLMMPSALQCLMQQ